MKPKIILAGLALLAMTAQAGEKPVGGDFYFRGTVEGIQIRKPNVFIVTMKDPDDGAVMYAWCKDNTAALATLLAQKAAGASSRIFFQKMSANHDRDNYCHDMPYERWVCNSIFTVDGF